jgi:hypothetical protein
MWREAACRSPIGWAGRHRLWLQLFLSLAPAIFKDGRLNFEISISPTQIFALFSLFLQFLE